MKHFAALIFVTILLASAKCFSHEEGLRIIEGYPAPIQAKLIERNKLLNRSFSGARSGHSVFEFIKVTTKWSPGQIVTVAFRGGNSDLYRKISLVANEWTTNGNIHFDFGNAHDSNSFRLWTLKDKQFAANIRIAFDDIGYWSLVGTESSDGSLVDPTNTSLNLQDFDKSLPSDWSSVVLHEFGHALGFMHEHQSPEGSCDLEFRWEDDPGYKPTTNVDGAYVEYADASGKVIRPGVYRVLEGPPNNWSKDMIDDNLRRIPDSHAYLIGPFDVHSIMMYSFDPWMYVNGTNTPCYTSENMDLSEGDKRGVAEIYPNQRLAVDALLTRQKEFLSDILSSENASAELKKKYRSIFESK